MELVIIAICIGLSIPAILTVRMYYLDQVEAAKEEIKSLRIRHRQEIQKEKQSFSQRIKKINEKIQPLLKYQKIKDVDDYATRLKRDAEIAAGNERIKAENFYNKMVEMAKEEASSQEKITQEYKIKANEYSKVAEAMKNFVHGYNDEYVIPNNVVLDQLAEDFSHKDSGIRLKEARVKTKKMVSNGLAADCEYVESYRRSTAIIFIIDAFNGKTDSVLSSVRHNNYGKLKQKIIDSYHLVNKNGEAFRNAKILPDYLEARLEELKWAVATQELKQREQEEQKRIKEAIREEEKARKEYEKAIREAEKEENTLQKAMEKAHKMLEEAKEEQKEKFEQKIFELQEKLKEVEEKNQRAISMAEQTKRGHVYIISNIGSFGDDVLKIGLTRRLEPTDRVKELSSPSVPFSFDIHAMIYSEDAPALENKLHKKFSEKQVNKINSRKEFFRISTKELRESIEEMGINIHWTMLAEAKEYRETIAINSPKDIVFV